VRNMPIEARIESSAIAVTTTPAGDRSRRRAMLAATPAQAAPAAIDTAR